MHVLCIVQANEEPEVEGSSEQPSSALTVTQPNSQDVTDGQQDISYENEPSSSESSTYENDNGSCSSETPSSSGSSNTSSSSYYSSFEKEIQAIFGPETSYAPTSFSLKTFKLVGDNLHVDKNVKPSDVRVDSQTKSLHYFQTYAVRDRIDLTAYDETPPVIDESKIDSTRLLPSESDHSELTKNFSFLVARVLKQYMPFFEKFGSGLERHIRHKFYEEMGQKSEVVS
jgi:L1 cell adhesion molecule like protein